MITVLGADVTEGQEVKLGGRWRTVKEMSDPQDDTRTIVAVDVSGRVRTAKLSLKTSYPVRRGAIRPDLRYGFYESTRVRNSAGDSMGRAVVIRDDGGPVVRIQWMTNALGLDVRQREQDVDRYRLTPSYGQYKAWESELTNRNTED